LHKRNEDNQNRGEFSLAKHKPFSLF